MKKRVYVFLLLLFCISLFAQRPHQVVVEVVASDGSLPAGVGNESNVSFTADLYRSGSTVGDQVTQATQSCFYYTDGTDGVVWVEIDDCTSSWQFGDELLINVTCDDESGHALVTIGSIGDNKDEVPSGQGIQLLDVTEVSFDGDNGTANLTNGDFDVTKTGTGTVDVSAPGTDFVSLPGVNRGGRVDNIAQCFSVEFSSGISELATSFSWESSDITGSMSDKDLLVSVDGVNWIYSDNSSSGITGDVTWSFDDTPDPDEMTVSFTTEQDNALYAVSDGTNPEVTTPTAPSGGSASKNGDYVTISCRAVAVPGATYQVYYSNDFANWTSIGSNFTASSGSASKTVTHSMGENDVMYYGIKAYNGTTSYMSDVSSKIYAYQKHTFQTNSGNMTNLIPIPFDDFNNSFDTARLLGIRLGSNCNCIAKWNAETQRYTYCTQFGGAWRGDFDLESDGVYFVNLTGTVDAKIYDGVMNKSDFALKTGVNLIYVSALDADLTNASDLISDIGVHCTKVQQWDATDQEWDTYTGTESDFTLIKLAPVFVYVDAAVNYKK